VRAPYFARANTAAGGDGRAPSQPPDLRLNGACGTKIFGQAAKMTLSFDIEAGAHKCEANAGNRPSVTSLRTACFLGPPT